MKLTAPAKVAPACRFFSRGHHLDVLALFTADLHYSLPQFDWVRRKASSVDWCILGGDLLDLAGPVDLETQIVVAEKWVRKLRPRSGSVLCSGNHDLEPGDDDQERQAFWLQALRTPGLKIDGDQASINGWRVSILPWWDGPETLAAVRSQLARDAQPRGQGWIWVSHAPPSHSAVAWTGRVDAGDPIIRDWVEEFAPDLVLTGHVHFAPFVPDGSWHDRIGPSVILNPGRQSGSWPAHIILDTHRQTAQWFAAEGNEICAWGPDRDDQAEAEDD